MEEDDTHHFGQVCHIQTHLVIPQFSVQLHHPGVEREREGGGGGELASFKD